MSNQENIEKLESALGRLNNGDSVVYFLTYDTKTNARASVKFFNNEDPFVVKYAPITCCLLILN